MSSCVAVPDVRWCCAGRQRQAWSLLAILLVGMRPRSLDGQIVAPHPVSPLTGRVVNARTGAPLARVLVQGSSEAMLTNAEGRFTLSSDSGVTSLRLTKPGFSLSPEQRDPETLTIDPAASPASLEVELWPEAVLAGTVTSLEGDPLPRLTVSAERVLFQNGLRQRSTALSTTTDAHGGFRMPVPAGAYRLSTQYALPNLTRSMAVLPTQWPAPTANDATGTIHIASGEELHCDLHPVLAPVFRATMPLQGSSSQRYPAIQLTTSEGVTFRPPQRVTPEGVVLTLPAGSYQLAARLSSPEGQLWGRQALTVPDQDSTIAPLHLETVPATPIMVSVDPDSRANMDGSPLITPDASTLNLQLEPDLLSSFEGVGQAIRSDRREGGSSFLIPPGTYYLASGESSEWTLQSASFGGVDLLRHSLVAGASSGSEPIRVVVTHANGSISGVTKINGVAARCWIVVIPEAGALPHFFVRRSGTNGAFQITNLALRTYRLLAIPLLSTADFGQSAEVDRFTAYVQTIAVSSSSSAPLILDAVPVHELYP